MAKEIVFRLLIARLRRTKIELTDSTNTWKEIKLADGNKGWLPDSCIVKI